MGDPAGKELLPGEAVLGGVCVTPGAGPCLAAVFGRKGSPPALLFPPSQVPGLCESSHVPLRSAGLAATLMRACLP